MWLFRPGAFRKSSRDRTLTLLNEQFVLSVPSQHKIGPLDYIVVEVWDKDSLSADDLVGLPVFFSSDNNPQRRWHKLVSPNLGWRTTSRMKSSRWKNNFDFALFKDPRAATVPPVSEHRNYTSNFKF